MKWFGVVSACAAFVLIGALQALYGPAVTAFRADFGISVPVAGLALSAHFVGGIAGVLWYARSPLPGTRKLAASLVAMAAGAAGVALAPSWPAALAPSWPAALVAALVAGIGFGGIDYGCNDMFARAFRRRGSAMLNVLNAHFGIGAIAGPLLIGVLGPDEYPAIFLGFAVLSLLLLPGLRGPAEAPAEPAPAPTRIRLRGLLAAFIVLYVMNVGVEAGVGGWEPTHLEAIGHSASDAASATSVYWLMMTLGRFLVVPLTLRVSDRAIVIGSCVGIAVCLGLATVPGLAIVAYAGVGLFIAPVFPTGLPWLHRAVPGASRAGAYVFAASMLGGVAFPPLLGVGIERAGAGSVPVLIFIVNAVCLVAIWRIVRTESALPSADSQRV